MHLGQRDGERESGAEDRVREAVGRDVGGGRKPRKPVPRKPRVRGVGSDGRKRPADGTRKTKRPRSKYRELRPGSAGREFTEPALVSQLRAYQSRGQFERRVVRFIVGIELRSERVGGVLVLMAQVAIADTGSAAASLLNGIRSAANQEAARQATLKAQ